MSTRQAASLPPYFDAVITGTDLNDTLTGSAAHDLLRGLGGRDWLNGGGGNDTLDGGDGFDLAYYNLRATSVDTIITVDEDGISIGTKRDSLIGIEQIALMVSGVGNGTMAVTGSSRHEYIMGAYGDDTLSGGGGRDTLDGGSGSDRLTGGAGRDQFIIHPIAGTGLDTVTDFTAGDKIVFQTRYNGGEITVAMPVETVAIGDGTGLLRGQIHVQAVQGGVMVRAGIDDTAGFDTAVMLEGTFDLSRFISAGRGVGYGEPSVARGTPNSDLLRGTAYDDTLDGGGGNDRILGIDGADQVDGGSGIDAYAMEYRYDELSIRNIALPRPGEAGYVVVEPYGVRDMDVTNLRNVEFLCLTDRVLLLTKQDQDVSAALPLGFSEQGYLAANPDIDAAVANGLFRSGWDHYQAYGAAEGRSPTALFDAGWYLATNPDVAAAVAAGRIHALEHFMVYGWREGRDPSAYFDISAYLDRSPDVAAAGINPLVHYLAWGMSEGRINSAADTGWFS